MEGKKSTRWFILWAICYLGVVSLLEAEHAVASLHNKVSLPVPPFSTLQVILIAIVMPFGLVPMLSISLKHAIKEGKKLVKYASLFFILHHIVCTIAVLVQGWS